MKVFSSFNGMGCIWLALDKLGLKVNARYVSEVDKYANTVNDKHYPDTIHKGDITKTKGEDIGHIDLFVGGSPCQGFSFAGKQLNFQDSRSALFFEYVRLLRELREINPGITFLLENVRMKQEFQDVISTILDVQPIVINSALVSAQNRRRLYWTNIEGVGQPEDTGVLLKDILQHDIDKVYFAGQKLQDGYTGGNQLNPNYKSQANTIHNSEGKCGTICAGTHGYANGYVKHRPANIVGRRLNDRGVREDYNKDVPITQCLQVKKDDSKMSCLTTVSKDTLISTMDPGRYPDAYNTLKENFHWRKLTPVECERLQTVPDNFTELGIVKYPLYIYEELNDKPICVKKSVKLRDVTEMSELTNMENSVCYITKGSIGMGQLNSLLQNYNLNKNVSIVVEKLGTMEGEQEECVINITKTGLDMEMLCTQIKRKQNLGLEDIKKRLVVKMYTGELWKITWEENLLLTRQSIISILSKLITELKIFSYVKIGANIHFSIEGLKLSQDKWLKLELSNLKMENIITISDSQRYKLLGNGWTIDVISHILSYKYGKKETRI